MSWDESGGFAIILCPVVWTSPACGDEPRSLQAMPSFPSSSLSVQNLHRRNLELGKKSFAFVAQEAVDWSIVLKDSDRRQM